MIKPSQTSLSLLRGITTTSIRTRIVFSVLSLILYALLFPWLERAFGGAAAIVSIGPVVVAAWLLGFRGGLAASVVGLVINTGLAYVFVHDSTIGHWLTHGGILGFVALALTGASIGLLRDLSHRARSELTTRQNLELALQTANTELEARVGDRTKRLSEVNDSLTGEVAERVKSEAALIRSQKRLRALTTRIETIREEERFRIAQDIHDEFGQTLTGLKFDVAWLQRRLDQITDPALHDSFSDQIELIQSSLDIAIHTVRDISSRLRPVVLDNFGLRAAIEWQATDFKNTTGVDCKVNIPDDDFDIEQDREITVFRILQEALNNIARHANARHVSIDLNWLNGWVTLEIADDGIGMLLKDDDERPGLGLLGMRERAIAAGGDLKITSAPGSGVTVKLRVPAASLITPLDIPG